MCSRAKCERADVPRADVRTCYVRTCGRAELISNALAHYWNVGLLRYAFLILLLFSVPAAAQSVESSRFSVAGGAGMAFPFHSDFPDDAFAWHVSGRIRTAKFLSVDVTFDQWRHESSRVLTDLTLQGPSGVIGHVDEVRIEDRVGVDALSVSAMLGGTVGRVTLMAGGGPALVTYRDHHSQTLTGCTATVPQTCQDSSSSFSNPELGLQGAVDAGVRVTSRISAFTRLNVVGPLSDPGSGHLGIVGGVRVRLK